MSSSDLTTSFDRRHGRHARLRSSGSSAWYDLVAPNEVLKLLYLAGKFALAEDLWHKMAVLGMQGLIGWLVMMDVWQGRSDVVNQGKTVDGCCLDLATSEGTKQL